MAEEKLEDGTAEESGKEERPKEAPQTTEVSEKMVPASRKPVID
jgi:hypothetical protein